MNISLGYNSKIIRALNFATMAHEGQKRKGSSIPYIVHPVEVAMILQENNLSEDIIAAGLLHDILEDTDKTEEEIKNEFDETILKLVIGASEELDEREKREWEERKQHTIETLEKASQDIKLVSCADKLSNIRAMLRDYEDENIKENLWNRFTVKDPEKHKWYYEGLVKSLSSLEAYKMYEEFKMSVKVLFGRYK